MLLFWHKTRHDYSRKNLCCCIKKLTMCTDLCSQVSNSHKKKHDVSIVAKYVHYRHLWANSGFKLIHLVCRKNYTQMCILQIWILTGDKAESVENIAFFCGHFKQGTEILRLTNEDSAQSCFSRLTHFEYDFKFFKFFTPCFWKK